MKPIANSTWADACFSFPCSEWQKPRSIAPIFPFVLEDAITKVKLSTRIKVSAAD
jgi:hypothetical protein